MFPVHVDHISAFVSGNIPPSSLISLLYTVYLGSLSLFENVANVGSGSLFGSSLIAAVRTDRPAVTSVKLPAFCKFV